MKTKIFITLFFAGLIYSSYAFDNAYVDVRSKMLEYKGVKKITERTIDKWKVISFFDREGHVLQETHAFKKEMRSDYRFHYTVTDTLIEARRVNKIIRNGSYASDTLRIDQYYYNASNQCYKRSIYYSIINDYSDFYSMDNFVYEDGMLISYTQGSTKNILKYNEKKQKESRLEIYAADTTFYTYVYNQHGQLTDFIKESHDTSIFYGDAPTWNDTRGNKIHIRYSNFDKHGNWTRSYFITEKRRLLYSKRKIKYW